MMTRRIALTLLLVIAGLSLFPPPARAVGLCGVFYTYKDPTDTVTASNLNSNFLQAATTNSTPQCVQGDSTSLTQMQTTVDPQPSQTASLATSLEGELQRLRFVLKTAFGTTQWYTYTDAFVIGPQASTGSNLTGNSTTIQGGPGTGTGVGGNLVFRVSYPGSSGSTANTQSTVGTVNATNNQSSGTAALWSLAGTVNQSGTAGYTFLQANATETATGSGTNLLLDLQVGGVSKAKIDRTGAVTLATALSVASGGTGLATLTANQIPYGNGTAAFNSSSALTYNGTVLSAGCSTCAAQTIKVFGSNVAVFGSITSDNQGGVMLGDGVSNYLRIGGSVPTAGTCGTSAGVTASSTDAFGEIVTGTGSFTTCTVNFSHTLSRAPFCTITDASTTSFLYISAKSTTSFTISTTAAGLASVTIDWVCGGFT